MDHMGGMMAGMGLHEELVPLHRDYDSLAGSG